MSQARIQNTGVVADFKAALRVFEHDARAALLAIDLEIGRAVDWLTNDQIAHWHHEVRKRGDAVVQAKAELHRCRSTPMPGGGTPSCQDQKRDLERAQVRLREAEDKVRAVRQWIQVVQREVGEYQGRANQLTLLLDANVPRAMATLEHVEKALDSYLGVRPASAGRSEQPRQQSEPSPREEPS